MEQRAVIMGAATYAVTRSFTGRQTREALLADLIRKKMEGGRFVDARDADEV